MISRRTLLAAPFLALPARAQGNEVDVALVLAADVSGSMTPESQAIQRRGYADAIADPQVLRAIRGGSLGRIAVLLVEWAGESEQRIIVPWTVIDGEASARALAASLAGVPGVRWGSTSISGALLFSASQIAACPYQALRRVIDVSGDGINNQGANVWTVRDTLLASGIVINGLPILNAAEPTLLEHYETQVIGGPGSFVLPVSDLSQFREALRAKLILEIA